MPYDLDFEKPLAHLEKEIHKLQSKQDRLKDAEKNELHSLEQQLHHQTALLYQNLTPWQTVQVARHKDRPYALDYIHLMSEDFSELHGDRLFADDHAIAAGPARFNQQTVMFICHQKGRSLKEKQYRNLGLAHPEGFRKAHRLMMYAEQFGFPILCLIDTPGASPALIDEERGQAAAIANNLFVMSQLRVPIIATIIGEGGSGGALAIAIADRVLMLEHGYYSVAAPEAASDILWRSRNQAALAAEAQHITAKELLSAKLIDEIVPEPIGGAHRDHHQTAAILKEALTRHLDDVNTIPLDTLLEKRYQRFRMIGEFDTVKA